MAAGAISRLVFGFVGGVYADRWDRQRTLIVSDLLSAVAVATLLLAAPGSAGILFHLAAVSAWLGMLDSLFQPALQASLPAIAPDSTRLQAANAWLDVTRRLAMALGPSATGYSDTLSVRSDREGIQLPVHSLASGRGVRIDGRAGDLRGLWPTRRDGAGSFRAWKRRALGAGGCIATRATGRHLTQVDRPSGSRSPSTGMPRTWVCWVDTWCRAVRS